MDNPAITHDNRKRRKLMLSQRRHSGIIQFSEYMGETRRNVEVRNPAIAPGPSQTQYPNQLYLGLPKYERQSCGALSWYNDRIYKSRSESIPKFFMCCQEGPVYVPVLVETPQILDSLFDCQGWTEARKFCENISLYNSMFAFTSIGGKIDIDINRRSGHNSMFAFTSIGGKIDTDINRRSGPYVFRIIGQNHHIMGSLLPVDGHHPKFAQFYIYDTEPTNYYMLVTYAIT